jgi:4-deoxy-L-threo-5-hexosulose-uronate ketol-isomerase
MRYFVTGDCNYRVLSTTELRSKFMVRDLFVPGTIEMARTDLDRAILGAAIPLDKPLDLPVDYDLRAATFCERRELGVMNLGGAGTVTADGKTFALDNLDALYLGRGTGAISFASADAKNPAQFYLLSYPAHATHPTVLIKKDAARRVELGTVADANKRTIRQYIHALEGGVKSCQLVMGYTELHEGAVWNTFPPHTHDRRTEVYLYFDLPKNGLVMHFMGEPTETRHLAVREKDGVLSPSWSCHCGAGTGAYRFVWGMGGENQTFDDMDPASMATLA